MLSFEFPVSSKSTKAPRARRRDDARWSFSILSGRPTKMRAFIEGLVPHERKTGFVMPFISELKTTSPVCSLEVSKTLNRNLGSGTVGRPGPSQLAPATGFSRPCISVQVIWLPAVDGAARLYISDVDERHCSSPICEDLSRFKSYHAECLSLCLGYAGPQEDRAVDRCCPPALRESSTRPLLIVATAWSLLCAGPAFAQIDDPLTGTPSLGVTSPLGMGAGASVGATGIPLGSTEIASPGVSPAPSGVTGTIARPGSGAITSSGTTCSTVGTTPSGMYGSTATYDGGGTAAGTAAPATAATSGATATSGPSTTFGTLDTSGLSGACGSGSSSIASSSTPTSTSPTTPGGAARTGIPLGSTEINNLGVSSAAAVPMIGVFPITGSVGSLVPSIPTTMPAVSSPLVSSTTPSPASGNISGNSLAPGPSPSGSTLAPTGAGSGFSR
jgi:hypothetical protein